jgi:glutathione S-transferase
MTFQVAAIYLYGPAGEVRAIDFRLGALNVITGSSQTGKSSITTIIDYCLGSTGFPVFAGAVRDTVICFALRLSRADGESLIVSRKPPEPTSVTQSRMYVGVASSELPPAISELNSNSDLAAAVKVISRFAGIGEDTPIQSSTQTVATSATIRQALFFCMQGQDEVASQRILFHGQGEEWRPNAIRQALPYFLGVGEDESPALKARLASVRKELRALRAALDDQDSIASKTDLSSQLAQEAVALDLVADVSWGSATESDILRTLESALQVVPDLQFGEGDEAGEYERLVGERRRLRQHLGALNAELRNAQSLSQDHDAFADEASIQVSRLQSLQLINWLPEGDVPSCPVCQSLLPEESNQVDELKKALLELREQTGALRIDAPRTAALIGARESQIAEVKGALRDNTAAMEAALQRRSQIAEFEDEILAVANLQGRITLFLESRSQSRASAIVEGRVSLLLAEEAELVRRLEIPGNEELLESALSQVSAGISEMARRLNLEHSEFPVRLDLRRLTVVVDTNRGPIALSEMGSGANWVGYHVATFLALQRFFIQRRRPVPRFLLLDQPSQVYFPSDDPDGGSANDEDRQALTHLLQVINEVTEELAPNLQVILLEHADLTTTAWFNSAVVERWRDDRALIPEHWKAEPRTEDL